MSDANAAAPEEASPETTPPAKKKRQRVFRWEGIIPFVVMVALLTWGWILFSDKIIQQTLSEASTKALGTQVDVSGLHLSLRTVTLRMDRLEIADPFDRMRNLVDAGPIIVELERDPLLERKIIVKRMAIQNAKRGTRRTTAAKPITGPSFAGQTLREVDRFTKQFKVPVLRLLPLDTIKSLVLDPRQLGTVQIATRLIATADSVRDGVRVAVDTLRIQQTLDSVEQIYRRLRAASPRALGIAGTRQLIEETRSTLRAIDNAKRRVEAVKTGVTSGVGMLKAGVLDVDSARKADYEFARGLLKLPTFEGPEIGNALFGKPSIERFEQAVYYAKLAEKYVPPGLKPRPQPGPERLRAAGTTVRFPRPKELPAFLLRRGDLDFSMADAKGVESKYTLGIADVTSDPALIGRPARFAARRTAKGGAVTSLRLAGVSDHGGRVPRDSVVALASGVKLPGFTLPGIPLRLDLGSGSSGMTFVMRGDAVRARWEIAAPKVLWISDSAAARSQNKIQELVARALTGIPTLTLAANLSGTISAPTIQVSSNLDEAIRQRIRTIFGEELAKAEAKARAAVDRIVSEKTAEVKQKVDSVATEADARIAEAQTKLEEQRVRLDERVKELTRGLAELPRLPTLPSIPRPESES